MARNRTTYIDVQRSATSKKDLQNFLKDLGDATKNVNELVKGYQELSRLQSALRTKGVFDNPLGPGAYNRGRGYQERRQATEVARLGTQTGQAADQEQRLLKTLKEQMKTREGMARLTEARSLNLAKELKSVEKITDRIEAQNKAELAALRTAEARKKVLDETTRRDALTGALRDKRLDEGSRASMEAERAAINARLRSLRTEARQSEKLYLNSIRQVDAIREQTRAAQERVKFDRESERVQNRSLSTLSSAAKDRQRRQNAERLNLQRSLDGVRKITDLEALRTVRMRAQDRLRLEENRGNLEAVRQARILNQLVERRLRMREREVKAQKESAKPTDAQIGARSRAMSRERLFGDGGASLFGIQTGLLFNYAAVNEIQNAISASLRFTIELDAAFRNLQAIVRVTDTDLQKLKSSLIDISEETKFTAVEVAQSAVTLGQAGFSTDEIEASMRAVSLLATATGTDLARSVDIATATLGVFNMESSQMAMVANTLTEAVNTSKLNIEKLTLGLQYSGNIAAQSGVSFKELTSALGAMANAGIRSGSTLGTGMRQILIALQKPSNQFAETLDRLGLTMQDVDLETKGLYGALKNLRDAGFTASDAIQSFEVRAAAAYNALAGNLDQMLELQNAFQGTSASIQANETQMRSLQNQGLRLASVLGSIASTGMQPLLVATTGLITTLGDLLTPLRENEALLQVMVTGVTSLAAAFIGVKIGKLVLGLTSLAFGVDLANVKMNRFTGAIVMANLRAMTLRGTLIALRGAMVASLLNPVGLATLALGGLAYAAFSVSQRNSDLASSFEKAQTAFDRSNGAAEKSQKTLQRIDGTIEDLLNKYDILTDDQALLQTAIADVQSQFVEMGRDAAGVGTNVDELIESLRRLRRETAEDFRVRVQTSVQNLGTLLDETQRSANATAGTASRIATERAPQYLAQNAASAIRSTASPLFSGSSSANAVGTANARLRQQLQSNLDRMETTGGSGPVWRELNAQNQYIELLLKSGDELETQLRDIERLRRQRIAQLAQERIAADEANPEVERLLFGATQFNSGMASRVREGALTGTANERLTRGRANQAAIDAEGRAILGAAEFQFERGTITSAETLRRIRQNVREAMGTAEVFVTGLVEDADKVNEKLTKARVQDAQDRYQQISAKFGNVTGIDQRAAVTRERLVQLDEVRRRRAAAIKAQNLEPEVEANTLSGLDTEIARDRMAATQDLLAYVAKVSKEYRGQVQQLTDQNKLMSVAAEHGKDSVQYRRLEAKMEERKLRIQGALAGFSTEQVDNVIALVREGKKLEQQQADLAEVQKRNKIEMELLELEQTRIRVNRELTRASEEGDQARIRRAKRALLVLEDEEESIRDIENRVKGAVEQFHELNDAIDEAPLDQQEQLRDLSRDLWKEIKNAVERGDKLSETDLTNLLDQIREMAGLVKESADGMQGISTMSREKAQDYYGAIGNPERYKNQKFRGALNDAVESQNLFDLIQLVEGTMPGHGQYAKGYNTVLGGTTWTNGEEVNPANRTLAELNEIGKGMIARNKHLYKSADGSLAGSSAMGAFQITTANMRAWAKAMGKNMNEVVFSPDVQREIASWLMQQGNFSNEHIYNTWQGFQTHRIPLRMIGAAKGDQSYRTLPEGDSTSGERDPMQSRSFNKLMEGYRQRLSTTKTDLEADKIEPDEAIGNVAAVLAEANAALKEREATIQRISALKEKTNEQEQQLATAVREEKTLMTFIRSENEKLLGLKQAQVDAQFNLQRTLKEYSANNLDLGKNLEEGLVSALSSIQSGFATLFTDLTSGTKTAAQSFRDFGISVIKSLQQVIAKMIAVKVMQSVIGMVGADTQLGGFLQSGVDMALGRKREGGMVPGLGGRDSIPHLLMPGEYVLRKSAVDMVGVENLNRINAMGNRKAMGGLVGAGKKSGAMGNTNVWVVSPDQRPAMGPEDVEVVVADNIARGGQIKQLIKSVQMGGM